MTKAAPRRTGDVRPAGDDTSVTADRARATQQLARLVDEDRRPVARASGAPTSSSVSTRRARDCSIPTSA